MRPVHGTSVLVTGGGSGIGAGTARLFAAHGARVTICGRRPDRLEKVAATIGSSCEWLVADVDDPEDRAQLIDVALAHGGGIDTLVHSAGNMYRALLPELIENDVLRLFQTNVVSALMLTQQALPHLEARRGCVVFFGSAHVRRIFPGASPYAATKAAAEMLTASLAGELGGRGVRVGCVRPGSVLTEINVRAGVLDQRTAEERSLEMRDLQALGRLGTVDDIAEAVEYLATAEWTTGAVIPVDGGLGLARTAV